MQREIKFRAWSKETKKMYYVPAWYFSLNVVAMGMGDEAIVAGTNHVEVMEYTGLKDKNGKEIYEGDILASGSVIKYGAWNCGCCDDVHGFEGFDFGELGPNEVIGNVFEHPDLLK